MRGGNILKDQLPSGSLAIVVPYLLLLIQNPKTLPYAGFNRLHPFSLRLLSKILASRVGILLGSTTKRVTGGTLYRPTHARLRAPEISLLRL